MTFSTADVRSISVTFGFEIFLRLALSGLPLDLLQAGQTLSVKILQGKGAGQLHVNSADTNLHNRGHFKYGGGIYASFDAGVQWTTTSAPLTNWLSFV